MGQQQIILLVLVTVVVGIATVVAINTMEASRKEANRDAIRSDMRSVIADAQKYYYTFQAMGGGGNSFDGISINHVSLSSDNENASYKVQGSGQQLEIKANSVYEGIVMQVTATMQGTSGRIELDWQESGVTWE